MIVGYPNVAMANWSLSSIWGGASLLQVLLQCLDDLLHKPDWHWDFIINLSETDYPIKYVKHYVVFVNLSIINICSLLTCIYLKIK